MSDIFSRFFLIAKQIIKSCINKVKIAEGRQASYKLRFVHKKDHDMNIIFIIPKFDCK